MGWLRRRVSTLLADRLRSLPYLVHTNRELGLMLRGAKPLAKFVDHQGHFPDVVLRYIRMFDRHVDAGRLVRRDEIFQSERGHIHYIYFALPGEEWRIQAMIDLFKSPGPWSREKEREEGSLLGYTDEQNELWRNLSHPIDWAWAKHHTSAQHLHSPASPGTSARSRPRSPALTARNSPSY